MKVPKIREDEPLAAWCNRIADHFSLSDQVREIIREVSLRSYIIGTNVVIDTLRKEERI